MEISLTVYYHVNSDGIYVTNFHKESPPYSLPSQRTTFSDWDHVDLDLMVALETIRDNKVMEVIAGPNFAKLIARTDVRYITFTYRDAPQHEMFKINPGFLGSKNLGKLMKKQDVTVGIDVEEVQYLNLLKKVALSKPKPSRAGPVRSTTLETMRFSLMRFGMRVVPMLTTKSMSIDSIWEELKMFIKGETNIKRLTDKKIPIWNINTSREHLDNVGLKEYPEGTLGPVYGFQWRHFGADWTKETSADNAGVDQLVNVIEGLKKDPYSRRHVVVAWNPLDIGKMALPPCHLLFEFIVNSDGELDCVFYMRSADLALGVPYNLVSYALLTHLVSMETQIPVGSLLPVLADCHVYDSHLAGVAKQLSRTPQAFPCITLEHDCENFTIDDVDSVRLSVMHYCPDSYIKLPMAN